MTGVEERVLFSERASGIRGLFQDKSRLFVFSASVIVGFFVFRCVYAAFFAVSRRDTTVIHRSLAEESTTTTASPSIYDIFEYAISLYISLFW